MPVNRHLRAFGEFAKLILPEDTICIHMSISNVEYGYLLRYTYATSESPSFDKYCYVQLYGDMCLDHVKYTYDATIGDEYTVLNDNGEGSILYDSIAMLFFSRIEDTIMTRFTNVAEKYNVYSWQLSYRTVHKGAATSTIPFTVLCDGNDVFSLKAQMTDEYIRTLKTMINDQSQYELIELINVICRIFSLYDRNSFIDEKVKLLTSTYPYGVYAICPKILNKYITDRN